MNNLITKIETAIAENLRALNTAKTHANINCSSLGNPCERYIYFEMLVPVVKFSDETLLRLWDGHLHENMIVQYLTTLNFKIEQREREVIIPVKNRIIKGYIDGIIRDENRVPQLIEIKAYSPNLNLNTFEDFTQGKYTARAHMQMQLYMYALELQNGILIHKNKGTGKIRFMDIPYNEDIVENAFAKADRLHNALETKQPPEPHITDDCLNCPFVAECQPTRHVNENALKMLEDGTLDDKIGVYIDAKEKCGEITKIKEQYKKELQGEMGLLTSIEAPTIITDKWFITKKQVNAKNGVSYYKYDYKEL